MAGVDLDIRGVGVAVVPGHEVDRAVVSRQLFAADPELTAGRGPDGIDDRVMVGQQIGVGDPGADLHIEMAVQPGVGEPALEHPDHILGGLMVGCDSGPDEAERCW